MKKIAILVLAVMMGFGAAAQTAKTTSTQKATTTATSTSSIQKVVIQTNGVCEKCEALFKENVPYFKGVKDYTYDPKTSKMTITYDSKKTNPDLLRQQISKLGYNADNVIADQKKPHRPQVVVDTEKITEVAVVTITTTANKNPLQSRQRRGKNNHKK